MLNCDEVLAQLWSYLDGELDDERNAKLRAHLEVCRRCFPQYDFQRAYVAFMRRTARPPVPAALRRNVFQRLLVEAGRARGPTS